MKQKIALIALIALLALLCVGLTACGLTGNDKECYDIVLAASYSFKNPKSVRVISGKLTIAKIDESDDIEFSDYDRQRGYKVYAYLTLSATNGYGATTSENYFLYYDDDGNVVVASLDDELEIYENDNTSIGKAMYKAILSEIKNCKDTTSFDADKVNAALAKRWENY